MSGAYAAQARQRPVVIETPNFYMRKLTPNDATERSGAWFDQPEICEGLNLKPAKKSKAEFAAYIESFDQHSNRISGVFDKRNGLLVTLSTAEINWGIRRVLMNVLVGEPEYRHCGVILEALIPARDFYAEDLDMKVMTATALATNKPVIALLEMTGFTRNQTLKNQQISCSTGLPVDLHLYSQTREDWRKWKVANKELVEQIRDCSSRLPAL
jgi:RimJ/RimL family protein N-acetyltransferase